MMKYLNIVIALVLFSCGEEPQKKMPDWDADKSVEMNQEFAAEQEMDIDMFVSRLEGKEFRKTGSGLRYAIVKSTNGVSPKVGQDAKIQYKVSLLSGDIVYETPKDEVDVFRVDNSQIESGIHEGIKLMKVGETFKLIFPSHLAHGLVGDLKKIPPLSPLVVDVQLIEVQ